MQLIVVLCCLLVIAGYNHSGLSESLRQSAGKPKPSKGPFGLGWGYTWHHHHDKQSRRVTKTSNLWTSNTSEWCLYSYLPEVFGTGHWSLTFPVWFLQGLVFLLNPHVPSTLCSAPPQHCFTSTPNFTSSPLPETQEAENFGPPQAEVVGDVTTPRKRPLTPSVDCLHPVL